MQAALLSNQRTGLCLYFAVPSSSSNNVYTCSIGAFNRCSCSGWVFSRYPDKSCVHLKDICATFGYDEKANVHTSNLPTKLKPPFSEVGQSAPARFFSKQDHKKNRQFVVRTKLDGVRVAVLQNGMCITRQGLFLGDLSRIVQKTFKKKISEKKFPPLDCELVVRYKTSSAAEVVEKVINRAKNRLKISEVSLAVLDVFVPAIRGFSDTSFTPKDLEPVLEKNIFDQFFFSQSNSSETGDFDSYYLMFLPEKKNRPSSKKLPADFSFQKRLELLKNFFGSMTAEEKKKNGTFVFLHEPGSEPRSEGDLSQEVLLMELQKRLQQKHEGVVVQNLGSNYAAGSRNAEAMFKIKKIEDVLGRISTR